MMLSTRCVSWSVAVVVSLGMLAGVVRAQDKPAVDAEPKKEPAAAKSDDGRDLVMAKVIEVHGDVKHAPLDSQEYEVCELGDEYPEKTKIITGVRSSIKLQIGDEEPYTCLLIEAVGKTILSEAYKTETTKKVRIGVGYGRIRAGVAEGGLESDFTVDSPVATLSKRGTWGFTLFYERDTDFFSIGLTDRGLVEALDKVRKQQRQVKPREMVTSAMRMWLDQSRFDRNVPIPDILGQGDIDVAFNRMKQDGLGVLGVGGGKQVLINLSNQSARGDFERLARRSLPHGALPFTKRHRPEGFFGTGRGDELIGVMIENSNPLVQQGHAKPGNYKFRRSVLQSWLRDYRTTDGRKP